MLVAIFQYDFIIKHYLQDVSFHIMIMIIEDAS